MMRKKTFKRTSERKVIIRRLKNVFEEEPDEEEDEWPISDDPDNPENEP